MVAIECLYHIIDHVTIMLWLQRNHIQNAAFIIIASLATQKHLACRNTHIYTSMVQGAKWVSASMAHRDSCYPIRHQYRYIHNYIDIMAPGQYTHVVVNKKP